MRSIEYKTAIARQENAELVRFIESIYRSIISYADETSGEELGELIAQLKERRKSNSASVSTFISWLENPLLRMVIRFSGDRHLRSGESYLKAALDDIAEEGSGDRSLARRAFSGVIKMVVNLGCMTFNVDRTVAVSIDPL